MKVQTDHTCPYWFSQCRHGLPRLPSCNHILCLVACYWGPDCRKGVFQKLVDGPGHLEKTKNKTGNGYQSFFFMLQQTHRYKIYMLQKLYFLMPIIMLRCKKHFCYTIHLVRFCFHSVQFLPKKVQLQLFKNLVNLHFIEQHNRDNILNV